MTHPQNPRHCAPRFSAIQKIEQAMKLRKQFNLKSPYEIKKAAKIGIAKKN